MNKQQLLKSLEEKGFSKSILNAFSKVKRENFIPKNLEERAYEDAPLPIGERQTIDRKSTRLNSSHIPLSRMPSSA